MGCETTLSVFFLRDHNIPDLTALKKEWDIIVKGDGSFILPHAILHTIAGEAAPNLQLQTETKKFFVESPIYAEVNTILGIS